MPTRKTLPPVGWSRLILYALLTSLTAISIDAILPGLIAIEETLGTQPPLQIPHIVSLFVLGMAFGELMIGPISDAYGRKTALLAGLSIYIVGNLIAMLAASLEALILGRVLQGPGVSGPKIAMRAKIRDQCEGDAMARVMSFMFTLFILVPMVGPARGQDIVAISGWRRVFFMYLVLALSLGAWIVSLAHVVIVRKTILQSTKSEPDTSPSAVLTWRNVLQVLNANSGAMRLDRRRRRIRS